VSIRFDECCWLKGLHDKLTLSRGALLETVTNEGRDWTGQSRWYLYCDIGQHGATIISVQNVCQSGSMGAADSRDCTTNRHCQEASGCVSRQSDKWGPK
jgi:hypothetical protein